MESARQVHLSTLIGEKACQHQLNRKDLKKHLNRQLRAGSIKRLGRHG